MPNKRRGGSGTVAERKNSGGWPRRTCRKVIPTDQLVSVLENLLAPGDRVVLEGNNQKQADFLSRMLAEVNPQNSRPAYDYAQRRAQRASGPV